MEAVAAIPTWVPTAFSVANGVMGFMGSEKQSEGASIEAQGQQLAAQGAGLEAQGDELSAANARRTGEMRRTAAEFSAQQLEQQAGATIAAAQRNALDEQRQTKLVESRAIALAAAGGGSASDPTVINMVARISGEGAYRQMAAVYQGAEQARLLKLGAAAKRYEGDIAVTQAEGEAQAYEIAAAGARTKAGAYGLASDAANVKGEAYGISGVGSLLSGGGSLLSKYGGKGPTASSPAISDSWLDF